MTNKKKPGRPKKIVSDTLSRWTILIPWETRISVTKAAERQQMNLNAWIDNALFNASREVFNDVSYGTQNIPIGSCSKKEVIEVNNEKEILAFKHEIANKLNRPWWKRIWSSAHDN